MLCLQFEITQDEVNDLKIGFQDWVKGYELYVLCFFLAEWCLMISRLYYQHDPEHGLVLPSHHPCTIAHCPHYLSNGPCLGLLGIPNGAVL